MLNNKKLFAGLMDLLDKVDHNVPLPEELSTYLWEKAEVEPFCSKVKDLETEGKIPEKAYYVVRGFVIVYGFDQQLDRYVFRIYRENTIVGMNCFIQQQLSDFTITACKETLLWSLTHVHLLQAYQEVPGMEQLALKTALAYSDHKESSRAALLVLETEEKILRFYQEYKGLLPARQSPIKDASISCFLDMSIITLRRTRDKLRKKGLLSC